MNKPITPSRTSAPSMSSLLERATELFDINAALRGDGLPALDVPDSDFPKLPEGGHVIPMELPVSYAEAPELVRARAWTGPVRALDRVAMAEAGYLIPGGSVSGIGEEFRIIKRELLGQIRGTKQTAPIENGNVILVASAHPDEGKTYCAINLAVSLAAESDLEVLLVDADFAKPGILAALGLEASTGFMDALIDPTVDVAKCVIRTDEPSLSVLAGGSATNNDSEYLSSARMREVIDSLVAGRPERVVIFDSSPLLAASPAAVLAGHVGQTILVVRADRTTDTALRDAADLLKGCAHIQLLLNGVKFSASGRRFGSYYGKGA